MAYEYRIKNAIIKANSPVASDKANPRTAYWNNCVILVLSSIAHRYLISFLI